VGAGFGGLNAAKALKHAPVDVLMVDTNNFHTFQPLLYQVATSALDAGDVAHQVRSIFERQKNFRFRQGTVTGVDTDARQVELADGARIDYDYLILAAGAVYNDFGTPGVTEHGFVLKSLARSVALRNHVLRRFERAATDPTLVERGELTFVIVGAGPTGVEMAGALVELFQRVLPADYPELDLRLARVVLLEAGPEVLPPFEPVTRRYTERVLRRRGVDVRLSATMAEATDAGVTLRSGEFIPSRTLIWAAGVKAHPLAEALDTELTRGSRVVVEPDLSLPSRPETFVVGDLAGSTDREGRPLPQVAQVAIQGGKHAAKTIVRRIQGLEGEPFKYHDLGSMAIIGRNAGVADLSRTFFNINLRGFVGWLGWLFLHLVYLPGFRNRFSTLFSWAYNYLTLDRHARLIVDYGTSEGPAAGWGTESSTAPGLPVATTVTEDDSAASGRLGAQLGGPLESPPGNPHTASPAGHSVEADTVAHA
jgi:NADH dehydrogenase